VIPKDKRIQSLINSQQVPNSRLCLLNVANCCLQATMGSLQNLTDSVADHLDPNIPYGDRLRSGGYFSPYTISLAVGAQQLADACGLRLGEATLLWNAARACNIGKQCLTAFNVTQFKTVEVCWLI